MGGGGSRSSTTTTTQNVEPWGYQQGFLKDLYRRARDLPEREYYPGETFVPIAPQREQALQMQEERAAAGSPLLRSAQAQNLLTTQGGYLDVTNQPGFQAAFDAARRQISPYIQGQAAGAGRYAGGLPQENEMRALGDAFASQWAPLYAQERQLQQAASLAAPAMAQQDYVDIGRLSDVGMQREDQSMRELQDQIARWNFAQEEPWTNLSRYSSIVQAGYPGSMSTGQVTQPLYGQSPLAGALGGGLAAYGLFGNPWGAAAGAALGGLSAK